MRGGIVFDAFLRGVGPGRSVVGSRRREVDVASLVKHMLRLHRRYHFCALGPVA